MKLELNSALVDEIVTAALREDLVRVREIIKVLSEKQHLESYERDDLKANRNYEVAIIEVLKYYTPYSEWCSFT